MDVGISSIIIRSNRTKMIDENLPVDKQRIDDIDDREEPEEGPEDEAEFEEVVNNNL